MDGRIKAKNAANLLKKQLPLGCQKGTVSHLREWQDFIRKNFSFFQMNIQVRALKM